jgi:hypothetical protein
MYDLEAQKAAPVWKDTCKDWLNRKDEAQENLFISGRTGRGLVNSGPVLGCELC